MEQIKVESKREGLEMKMDREQFAVALKTWRLRNGYYQRQVAARWGISRFSIMKAEAGQPLSWEMAYRMFARLSTELEREKVHFEKE